MMQNPTDQLIHMLSNKLTPTAWYKRPQFISVAWFIFAALYFPITMQRLFGAIFLNITELDVRALTSVLLLAAFFIFGSATVLKHSSPASYHNRFWWLSGGLLTIWFLAILSNNPADELSLHRSGLQFLPEDYSCGKLVLILSVVPNFILLSVSRWLAPVRPRLVATYLFLSTAAAAALCLEFICPHKSILHLLYGHFGMVLALGFFGFCLGRRLLKW